MSSLWFQSTTDISYKRKTTFYSFYHVTLELMFNLTFIIAEPIKTEDYTLLKGSCNSQRAQCTSKICSFGIYSSPANSQKISVVLLENYGSGE